MNRRQPDLVLLIIVVLLCLFGLTMVFSAAGYEDAARSGNIFAKSSKQLVAIGMGSAIALWLLRQTTERLRSMTPYIFLGNLALLAAVPFLGSETKGATRWIELGFIKYQPVEMVKVAVALGTAWWLDRVRTQLDDWRALAPGVGILGVVFAFTMLQPDFGSTVVMAVAVVLTTWVAGLRHRNFVGLVVGGVALGTLAVVTSEYRRARISAMFNPLDDCHGKALQVCQSLFALHRGGLEGRGLGQASAKLYYLPEAHNDFILAIVGEELGIGGVLALLALLGALSWRAWHVARGATSYFGFLAATAIALTTAGQALFNVAVALGWAPTKGLVLPFVSYGASAMVANLCAMGVLLSVSAEGPQTAPEGVTRTADAPAGA